MRSRRATPRRAVPGRAASSLFWCMRIELSTKLQRKLKRKRVTLPSRVKRKTRKKKTSMSELVPSLKSWLAPLGNLSVHLTRLIAPNHQEPSDRSCKHGRRISARASVVAFLTASQVANTPVRYRQTASRASGASSPLTRAVLGVFFPEERQELSSSSKEYQAQRLPPMIHYRGKQRRNARGQDDASSRRLVQTA